MMKKLNSAFKINKHSKTSEKEAKHFNKSQFNIRAMYSNVILLWYTIVSTSHRDVPV